MINAESQAKQIFIVRNAYDRARWDNIFVPLNITILQVWAV